MNEKENLWDGYVYPDYWNEEWQKSYPKPHLKIWVKFDWHRQEYYWDDGFYLRQTGKAESGSFSDYVQLELHEALMAAERDGYLLYEETGVKIDEEIP
jgi:hypothetical protein